MSLEEFAVHPDWAWCPKCQRYVHAREARIVATGDGRSKPIGLAPACKCGEVLVESHRERGA